MHAAELYYNKAILWVGNCETQNSLCFYVPTVQMTLQALRTPLEHP